ncbi:tripartite-type tricarboxylate transporter receptor subunit TctC [Variovorax paradoxus]|uniref:Bug family tripartite tricarboxylate transporter substrate binding protein n=1 Tax=Variovorax paradoxus TaxID=34073 RepID=UPI00277EAC34|nr:tripartite tricarboxylate transporter substrate binding protein [Variovorax paradoxus]MDP9962906.1 tripartite-type tricarboxylate transporter receptor subunit TctC [Variovorax paradoxus]
MHINRRDLIGMAASVAAGRLQAATDWPDRPIRIVVPFAAGGPTDFIARMIATPLGAHLGQPVVVENKPGASGNLGAQFVAESPADGYTLLHNTVGMQAINPLLYRNARFDPSRDLSVVGVTGAMPNVLVVNPGLPAQSVRDLVAIGREKPDRLSYATFGVGTSPHVYGEVLQKLGRFKAVPIPYKGSAPAITDVIGGQVDFLFDSMTTCVGQVQAGKLRGLAITSAERSALLPDVPTLKEAGFPAFDLKFWFSLQAPAGTPSDVMGKLKAAFHRAASEPAYTDGLKARGAEHLPMKASEVNAFVRREVQRWSEVARSLEIKPE